MIALTVSIFFNVVFALLAIIFCYLNKEKTIDLNLKQNDINILLKSISYLKKERWQLLDIIDKIHLEKAVLGNKLARQRQLNNMSLDVIDQMLIECNDTHLTSRSYDNGDFIN
jgi:hypothetical protein